MSGGKPTLPDDACCGCGACSAACPVGCLEMLPDQVGFIRPHVHLTNCISCGRCESICPSLQTHVVKDTALNSFWAKCCSDTDLEAASSGGIFGLLASGVLAEKGAVYGAAWSEDWHVQHVRITDATELHRIKMSKYVQSEVSPDIYAGVRADLDAGRHVLYSGTGCQIAGLKSYLGETPDSERLLCVEIVCHGVPSPKLWSLYVGWMEHKMGSHLRAISFREKDPDWENYSVRAEFSDGSSWQEPYMQCWYMAAFMHDYPLRPSCHQCPRKRCSGADIVLGDFWGVKSLARSIEADRGVSAVITNTKKGDRAISGLKDCECGLVNYGDILAGNRSLEKPAAAPTDKASFLEDLELATELSPLMAKWTFTRSPWEIWMGRLVKAKDLASEYGAGRTTVAFAKAAGRTALMMAKGADKETLHKMAEVAVEELRAKKSGGG